MKTILTIFIFSLLVFTSKAQWVELDPGVNVPYFSDVYAITPDIVIVVGANGTILKTTDGGETWVQKPSGTTLNLDKIRFTSPEIGYIISGGFESILLKTMDGGETWASQNIGEITFLSGLSCLNDNTIFISGSDKLLLSENGGNSFDIINSDFDYEQILFINNDIGFAWNPSNFNLSKTENGGGVWNETAETSPVDFLNEQIGFYYDHGLFKTSDGGNNFLNLGFGEWGYLTDIFAPNENNVWGILTGLLDGDPSSRGIVKVLPADPYSETIAWDNNPEIDMLSIHFADESTGYIVGYKNGKGAIWKNGTGINTMSTNEEQRNNEVKVYPNPTSQEINIEVQNVGVTNIFVSMTDMVGKQVYTQKFIANNKITIDIKNFPKGIYILSINNHSQKIIIN